jgi:tetratricopeptide (TPR) repeat protein
MNRAGCLLSAVIAVAALGTIAGTQSPRAPEATSLLGKPLVAPPQSEGARQKAEAELAKAEEAFTRAPGDPDAAIWLGRRTAYLGRYRDAIAIFTKGIERHPRDARMYRHRGHRYITVRELDRAIADLSRAAELMGGQSDQIEPDGQPNARNTPTSTLKSNIYYHLGLAHYVKGDFDRALQAYRACMEYSKNPDMLVATSHWLYMTLRRLQREGEARQVLEPITRDMDIIENASYHKLLLMYKGVEKPEALRPAASAEGLDAVTIGYGVGNWHLYNGRRDDALEIFREMVDKHNAQWSAFGYIAAEAELARTATAGR